MGNSVTYGCKKFMNQKAKKQLIDVLMSKQHSSRKSWNQLCRESKVSPSILSKFINTSSDISMNSLIKILNIFKVDPYVAIKEKLENKEQELLVDIPVVGISVPNNFTYKNQQYSDRIVVDPGISDPSFVKRTNLWEGYSCIISRFSPIYNWQLLFNPKINSIKKEQTNKKYSYIEFYSTSKGKNKRLIGNVNYNSDGKFYTIQTHENSIETKIPENQVIKWFIFESMFSDIRSNL